MKWKLLLILCLFIAGCQLTQADYTIGALIPLSGPGANVGPSIVAGMEIAVAEINEAGGINGEEIQLNIQDSKGNAKESVSAYRFMMDAQNPDIVISVLSSVSKALAPLAVEEETPLIATVATAPDITNEFTYRYYTTAYDEGPLLVSLAEELNVSTLGMLYLNDDYGQGLYLVIDETFDGNLFTEKYERDTKELGTEFLKLQEQDPDALVIVGFPSHLIQVVNQLEEFGWDKPVLAPSSISLPEVQSGISPEGFDLYGLSPLIYTDEDLSFRLTFEEYTDKPVDHYAAAGYDSVYVAYEYLSGEELEGMDFTGVLGSEVMNNHEIGFPLQIVQYYDS